MISDRYFYAVPGQEAKGPISGGVIKLHLKSGRLPKDTLVRHENAIEEDWFPARHVLLIGSGEDSGDMPKTPASKPDSQPSLLEEYQNKNRQAEPFFPSLDAASCITGNVLEWFGKAGVFFCIFASLILFAAKEKALGAACALGAISCLFSVGFGKIVKYLARIVTLLENRNSSGH